MPPRGGRLNAGLGLPLLVKLERKGIILQEYRRENDTQFDTQN